MEQRYDRQKGAVWFEKAKEQPVIVGGAGGIGSWLSLLLNRLGCEVYTYDFDRLEPHNLTGQLYAQKHIGLSKVAALNEVISMFGDVNMYQPMNGEYNDMKTEFMFSAFDNMDARKLMFSQWKKVKSENKIFIDGRLLAEQLQIFCVTPDKAELYEKEHLFDNSEAIEAPCTFKQTSHSAAMIASHMTGFFTNHLSNLVEPGTREVPFYWEYFIPIDLLNVN